MIHAALITCIALCMNSAYAAAGLAAAQRYRIDLSLSRGVGLLVFAVGTLVQCVLMAFLPFGAPAALPILAFGAAVTGAACDAACGYVFDAITLPCLALMLALSAILGSLVPFATGVAAAGGSLAVLYALTRGRGIGLGDVKLACCIGGGAGALGGIEALGVAFVLGGAYAAVLLITNRAHRGQELRFAPYLAAGMAVVVLHGAPG